MAYYLMLRDKKEYKPIDISDHSFFERTSKHQEDRYSLEELDRLTSQYSDMINFKLDLFDRGYIEERDLKKDVSIRWKTNDGYEKVPYDPVFKDGVKYLDITYLYYKIQSLSTDKKFLEKLVSYYHDSYVNNITLHNIREGLLGNPEIDIAYQLRRFMDREISKYEFNKEKNKWEYKGIKYRPLHDLAMFVYNYENPPKYTKKEINDEVVATVALLKGETYKPKTRKLVKDIKGKKKYQDEGQTSFLD